MRREELYLTDIIEAAVAIETFLRGVASQEFLASDLLQSAILQKLTIIGEAAARLPREFKEQHRHIPWSDIVGFRNIAVHAYFSVDWTIVWVTATQDAPQIRRYVAAILETDPGLGRSPSK